VNLIKAGVLGLLVSLMFSSVSRSQEGGEESVLFMGEGEVTTPSRRSQSIQESPFPVSVITAEMIESSGAVTVPEALSLLPGIDLLRLSEGDFEVSIRGFNSYASDKILVMLDSRPLFNLADATVDWNLIPVPIDEIERIEVVRGPGSALYGENAFFGIINIITRPTNGKSGRVSGKYGSGDSWSTGAAGSVPHIRTAYEHLYLDRLDDVDTDLDNPYVDILGTELTAVRAIVDRGYIKLDAPVENGTFRLGGGGAMLRREYTPGYESKSRAFFFSIERAVASGPVDYHATADVNYEDESAEAPGFRGGPYRSALRIDMGLKGIANPVPDDTLVLGIEMSHRRVADDIFLIDRDYRHQAVVSGYVENQLGLFEKRLFITTGLRVDNYVSRESITSPRAGVVGILSRKQSIRAGWSQGFRSPTIYELYSNDDTLPPFVFQGNEHLRPEKIMSYNAGYVYQDPDRLHVSLDLFYNDIHDLMVFEFETFTPTTRVYRLDNADDAYSYGGEAELRAVISSEVSVFANYSYTEAYYDLLEDELEAPFSPRHKANAGMDLSWKDLSFSVWARYVGEMKGVNQDTPFQNRIEMNDYATLSSRIAWEAMDGLTLSFAAQEISAGSGHFEGPTYAPVKPYYFVGLEYETHE